MMKTREFIAQSAARMTNHQGRKKSLRLAYRAAAADGLDERNRWPDAFY